MSSLSGNNLKERSLVSPSPSRPDTQEGKDLPATLRSSLPSGHEEGIRRSVQRTRAALKMNRKAPKELNERSPQNEEGEENEPVGLFRAASEKSKELLFHEPEDGEEDAGVVRSTNTKDRNHLGGTGQPAWALRVNGSQDMQADWIKRVVIRESSKNENNSLSREAGVAVAPGLSPKKSSSIPVKLSAQVKLSPSSKRTGVVVRTDENGNIFRQTLSVSPPPPPQNIFFDPLVAESA